MNAINNDSTQAREDYLAGKTGTGPDGSEPVTQLKRGVHGDNEMAQADEADANITEQRQLATIGTLPIWLAEKLHWMRGAGGKSYLSPNPEYLQAVIKDAPKFVAYGEKLASPDSVEWIAAQDLANQFVAAQMAVKSFDTSEREVKALRRFITERAASNFVYAAVTQFEIDNWAARSAARGQDASENTNFGQKQARRDEFAVNGFVWNVVGKQVFSDWKLDAPALERQAKSIIFQQARMATQDQQNPDVMDEGEQQSRAAAVAISRPI